MFKNTASFVIQVTVMIIMAIRVACNPTINKQCLDQISKVFRDQKTGIGSIKYAIKELKEDMSILTENEYALNYYNELKTYFRDGHIMDPQQYFSDDLETNANEKDKATLQDGINKLITTFGVQPVNILKHAYEKEIYSEDSDSLLDKYMYHIAYYFAADKSILTFNPEVHCEKEHVERECLNQLRSVFTNSKTAYECMQYAMKNLKIGSPKFSMKGYAMGYYNKLKKQLSGEDEYLKNIKPPEEFFKTNLVKETGKNDLREILLTFGDLPENYVLHVYTNEICDEQDISPKQLYIRYICDLVEAYDNTKLDQINPENYCKEMRESTNEPYPN